MVALDQHQHALLLLQTAISTGRKEELYSLLEQYPADELKMFDNWMQNQEKDPLLNSESMESLRGMRIMTLVVIKRMNGDRSGQS